MLNALRFSTALSVGGFLFREKKNLRKIEIEEVKKYNIPSSFFGRLHMGEDFITENNTIIKNELLTSAVALPKTFAYYRHCL